MNAESKPRPGDIGMISVQGATGWLIRFGQWINGDGFGPVQHAFVYVRNGSAELPFIIEAEPRGARMVHPEIYDDRSVWIERCPDEFREAVSEAAKGLVGTPYSFLDYAALAASRLQWVHPWVRWIGRALEAYVASTGHMVCSQLADEAARRGGWHLFEDGRAPQSVTPADIYNLSHR